jgi:N-acetylglucosaminyl-diphospho-decaprenol L-rhamnosyltransferase
MNVSIVVPVYNQLSFTKGCLDSIRKYSDPSEIIIVDNGSSDGTKEFLATCPDIILIANDNNRGFAGACNQGAKEAKGDWVVILNNDVIVSPNWLTGLIEFAETKRLDIVTPAIREGEVNYDMISYSQEFIRTMAGVARIGDANGICFMVRRQVFDIIGYLDENFIIGQFEDVDFFRRAKEAGFKLGITGRSFIHHFGSVTQHSIRRAKTVKPYEAINRTYYQSKWKLNWWRRFCERRQSKARERYWRIKEKISYNHSLKEKWINGKLRYY